MDLALKTALRLREYDDLIDPVNVYSLLGRFKFAVALFLQVFFLIELCNCFNAPGLQDEEILHMENSILFYSHIYIRHHSQ